MNDYSLWNDPIYQMHFVHGPASPAQDSFGNWYQAGVIPGVRILPDWTLEFPLSYLAGVIPGVRILPDWTLEFPLSYPAGGVIREPDLRVRVLTAAELGL